MHPFSISDALRYGWRMTRRFLPTLIGIMIVFLVLGGLRDFIGARAGVEHSAGLSMVFGLIWFVINGFFAAGAMTMMFDLMDRGTTSWDRIVAPTDVVIRYLWTSVIYMGVSFVVMLGAMLMVGGVLASQVDDMPLLIDGVRSVVTADTDTAASAGFEMIGRAVNNHAGVVLFVVVPIALLMAIVVVSVIALVCGLSYYLAVDKDLRGVAALKESYRLMRGHILYYAAFGAAQLGVVLLGFLAFVIGAVVAVPVAVIAGFYVYRALDGRTPTMPIDAPEAPEAAAQATATTSDAETKNGETKDDGAVSTK